ncbi:hypothetical protein L1887_55538 [Cichorium endivia]|nr:hypothetical protein L1887_55538 [Cichorium endivia]
MSTHLGKETKVLQALAASLYSPFIFSTPLDLESVEESLPLIEALLTSLPAAGYGSPVGKTVQALAGLTDTLQMGKQTTNAASRHLRTTQTMVADLRREREMAETAREEALAEPVGRADKGRMVQERVSGCGQWVRRWHWDNIRCFGGWVTWEYTRVGGIEWYRNSNTKCHTAASNAVPEQKPDASDTIMLEHNLHEGTGPRMANQRSDAANNREPYNMHPSALVPLLWKRTDGVKPVTVLARALRQLPSVFDIGMLQATALAGLASNAAAIAVSGAAEGFAKGVTGGGSASPVYPQDQR